MVQPDWKGTLIFEALEKAYGTSALKKTAVC